MTRSATGGKWVGVDERCAQNVACTAASTSFTSSPRLSRLRRSEPDFAGKPRDQLRSGGDELVVQCFAFAGVRRRRHGGRCGAPGPVASGDGSAGLTMKGEGGPRLRGRIGARDGDRADMPSRGRAPGQVGWNSPRHGAGWVKPVGQAMGRAGPEAAAGTGGLPLRASPGVASAGSAGWLPMRRRARQQYTGQSRSGSVQGFANTARGAKRRFASVGGGAQQVSIS